MTNTYHPRPSTSTHRAAISAFDDNDDICGPVGDVNIGPEASSKVQPRHIHLVPGYLMIGSGATSELLKA